MTKGKRFKRLVRARAAATGQSYTAALRRFHATPKEGRPMTTNDITDVVRCSFCQKPSEEVAQLIAGPGVYICNECIALGHAIVTDAQRAQDEETTHPPSRPLFERFTDDARSALSAAQQEAGELRHSFVGTEHLLLGVLLASTGPVATLLSAHDTTVEAVRAELAEIVGPSRGPLLSAPPFTPRAARTLSLALDEARRRSRGTVDTDDLLIGLLVEGEGLASQLLTSRGVTLDAARAILGRS